MEVSGRASPRDWGPQGQSESTVVSSAGLSAHHCRAGGSLVSSGSCSSYQSDPSFSYQATRNARDLKVFSDALAGHLQVVITCLSQTDNDLKGAAITTGTLYVELVSSAQTAAGSLAMTAVCALEKLPTLLWASRGHGRELQACVGELHVSMSGLRKQMQTVRCDYIDLLHQIKYLGQCTQVTLDQMAISTMPEPVEDEHGSLECQVRSGIEMTTVQKESQKYLELALMQVDSMCNILEVCSDFWLTLHQAELQVKKLEKESNALCEGPLGGPSPEPSKRHPRKAALPCFCEHLRSFCGVYSGVPPPAFKSHPLPLSGSVLQEASSSDISTRHPNLHEKVRGGGKHAGESVGSYPEPQTLGPKP